MQIISKIYASVDAALAALKAASPLLVSTDKDGEDHLSPCGLDADGARFDLIVTDVVAPTGKMIEWPEDGPPIPLMPEMAATGEVQVDLYWQGATLPVIAGGVAVEHAALAFEPPTPTPTQAPTPDEVPLWSLRAALREAGRFAAIDAFVEQHKDDMPALWEAWNMGNTVSRSSMLVASFAPQFQIEAAERDALMRRAAEISAGA